MLFFYMDPIFLPTSYKATLLLNLKCYLCQIESSHICEGRSPALYFKDLFPYH